MKKEACGKVDYPQVWILLWITERDVDAVRSLEGVQGVDLI
jgi:hypothetical protein